MLVAWSERSYRLSQRRACAALRATRSTIRYASRRGSQAPLVGRIREIAEVRVSYGYRRVHVLLRREGWRVNHKRVSRVYREEGLGLRRVPVDLVPCFALNRESSAPGAATGSARGATQP